MLALRTKALPRNKWFGWLGPGFGQTQLCSARCTMKQALSCALCLALCNPFQEGVRFRGHRGHAPGWRSPVFLQQPARIVHKPGHQVRNLDAPAVCCSCSCSPLPHRALSHGPRCCRLHSLRVCAVAVAEGRIHGQTCERARCRLCCTLEKVLHLLLGLD